MTRLVWYSVCISALEMCHAAYRGFLSFDVDFCLEEKAICLGKSFEMNFAKNVYYKLCEKHKSRSASTFLLSEHLLCCSHLL